MNPFIYVGLEEDAKRGLKGDPLIKLKQQVLEYFHLKDFKYFTRVREDLCPKYIFVWLLCEIGEARYKQAVLADMLRVDRTTVLHVISIFERGDHLFDNTYVYGNAITNHFYALREKILHIEPGKEIKPFIPVRYERKQTTPRFMRIFQENESDIMEMVEAGKPYEEINEKYFEYREIYCFKNNFKRYYPEVYNKIKPVINNVNMFEYNFKTYKENIKKAAEKGTPLREINDLYFGYVSFKNFKHSFRKHQPYLYERFRRNSEVNN